MYTAHVIMDVDVPNKNGRVYTKATINEALERWHNKQMFGQIGMPGGVVMDLNNVSHVVENLRINDNNQLVGDITILNTPQGKVLETLLDQDGLSFRPCGTGKVTKDGNGLSVISDYQLVSINAVFNGA